LEDHKIGESEDGAAVIQELKKRSSTYFDTFAVNLWKYGGADDGDYEDEDEAEPSLIPMRQNALAATHSLIAAGVTVQFVYMDCDWHYRRAKHLLKYIAE